MKLDSITSSVIVEITVALIIGFMGFLGNKIFLYLKKRVKTSSFRKKKDILLRVTDYQLKEYATGKYISSTEKNEALEFLKNDLNVIMNKLKEEESQIYSQFKTTKNRLWFYIITVFMFLLIQIVSWRVNWQYAERLPYLLFLVLLSRELIIYLKWCVAWRNLNQKRKALLKELNRAMLVLGIVYINLFELLVEIYDKYPTKNPLVIQKELREFGLEVAVSEIMRISLSYILKNKTQEERQKTISDIFKGATQNPDKYEKIPEDERAKFENMFLGDYIDVPYSEVRIIPL